MFKRSSTPATSNPTPQFGQLGGAAQQPQQQQQQQSPAQQTQANSQPFDPAAVYHRVCGGPGCGPG